MSSAQGRSAYRRILREVSSAYNAPKDERSKSIPRALRQVFTAKDDKAVKPADAQNILTFLRAHRQHKVLVARYNPGGDLTEAERIKATARRVGLDVPITHTDPGKGGSDPS